MQYFGRAIGSVSKTWNSINPATLSGAIDVIVVENEKGEMHCSPFHVRFGKFQLLRPSQKKVKVIVNGEVTDIPMKLNDEGEAFFVFETDGYVPKHLQTSPVISAASSPGGSPRIPLDIAPNEELEYLDIGEGVSDTNLSLPDKKSKNEKNEEEGKEGEGQEGEGEGKEVESSPIISPVPTTTTTTKLNDGLGNMSPIDRAKSITMKLNIPSKVEANGDILLDMHGYKSDKKDIHDTALLVKQLLQEEFGDDVDVKSMMNKDLEGNIRILTSESTFNDSFNSSVNNSSTTSNENINEPAKNLGLPLPSEKFSTDDLVDNSDFDKSKSQSSSVSSLSSDPNNAIKNKDVHFKTLRLSNEQLKCLSLNYGENDITYSVNEGKSIITCKLFLWKRSTPIVISDIDGTITRSDALGHVLTMLGRDWTHDGVAKLFEDIEFNGYNIMYLTARSVGLADTTRSYLQGVEQNGYKLPMGPVILSPDRTIAALRREIVLKQPEVFKMACLNDIRTLYYPNQTNPLDHHLAYDFDEEGAESGYGDEVSEVSREKPGNEEDNQINENNEVVSDIDSDEFTDINTNTNAFSITNKSSEKNLVNGLGVNDPNMESIVDETNTPFYAGFGNRITDAISYRSVGVPSSRIFTINPDGDVKMELLEMAGYKCSYVSILELVDQFFPPVDIQVDKEYNSANDINGSNNTMSNARNKYTDFNYWRSPDIDLSLISDSEDEAFKDGKIGNNNVNNANSFIIETNNENDGNKEESVNQNENDKENENRDKDKDKDDAKSVNSRFSFFMRSPLSSPRKTFSSYDSENEEDDVVDIVENAHKAKLNYNDKDAEDTDDGELEVNTSFIEGEYNEDDVSDSDYIYEESGEEEDDDLEEEDEDEREDGRDDDNSVSVDAVQGVVPKFDRSGSVSEVNPTAVHGRFV